MADAKEVILQQLTNITSPHNEIRQQSEQYLQALEKQPGYGVALTEIVLTQHIYVHLRQLASIALKTYVKQHWMEGDEHYVPPTATLEDKARIKTMILGGLNDKENKIRTAVAMAIASIAHWDWPERWSNFLDELLSGIRSDSPDTVKGCIKCLDVFVNSDNLSDTHLPVLFNRLFPEIFSIFSEGKFSARIRMRCISILYSLLRWLTIIREEHKADVKIFFQAVAPKWIPHFASELAQPDKPSSDCGMKIAIMKVLTVLVGEFSKYMKPYIPSLMEHIWSSLVHGLPIYADIAISSTGAMEMAQDSDGESLGFEALVALLLEFLHCLAEKNTYRKLLHSHLPAIMYVMIGYMQMTADQEDMWSNDPNQYIADEEDVFNNYSVRISSNNLITELLENMGLPALQALATASIKRLQEAKQLQQQNSQIWWKLCEAALTALGSAAQEIAEHPEVFNVGEFMQLLGKEVSNNVTPFLRGRALWCASQFAAVASVEYSIPFLAATTTSLQSPNEPIPVKIGACKAIASFCPKLSPDVLSPYMTTILTGVTALIPSANEDTLHLVLETLLVAIKAHSETTAQYEHVISPYVLSVWSSHYNDPLITEILMEILGEIASIPACRLALQGRMMVPIVTILKSPNDMAALTETAINMLKIVVNNNTSLDGALLVELFPLLISKLLKTDDTAILQEGASCLVAYIKVGGEQLGAWNLEGKPALYYIFQLVAKLLDSSLSDSAALHVGPLVGTLISKIPHHLGSFLDTMLTAVVGRLQTAKLPSLIQPLLLVFARLIHTHPSEIISFLHGLNVDGHTALEFILEMWTRWHSDFQGSYYIKLSTTALAKIFQMDDPRLASLSVRGDLIVKTDQGVQTRSKSTEQEEWTIVPLHAKILQLLLREYQIIEEERLMNNQAADLDYEEDEESDDDNAYTSVIDENPFVDASLFFPDDDEWKDDLDEEELKNDPINLLDMKQYTSEFLRNFAKTNHQSLVNMASVLSPFDQTTLQQMLH